MESPIQDWRVSATGLGDAQTPPLNEDHGLPLHRCHADIQGETVPSPNSSQPKQKRPEQRGEAIVVLGASQTPTLIKIRVPPAFWKPHRHPHPDPMGHRYMNADVQTSPALQDAFVNSALFEYHPTQDMLGMIRQGNTHSCPLGRKVSVHPQGSRRESTGTEP